MKYMRYVGDFDRRVIRVADFALLGVEVAQDLDVTKNSIWSVEDEQAEVLLTFGEDFEEVDEFEVLALLEEDEEDNGNSDA